MAKHRKKLRGISEKPRGLGAFAPNHPNPSARRHLKPSATSSAKAPSKNLKHPIIPFQTPDTILLIGEGDFSFAASVCAHHGDKFSRIAATGFDSRAETLKKYPQAEKCIKDVEEAGGAVSYSIDATRLGSYKSLTTGTIDGVKRGDWDWIIFNFPHVGELLVGFFKAAAPLLSPRRGSSIVVTLFEGEPYTLWNIRDLARHTGLRVQRSFKFAAEAYPKYSHARTLGNIKGEHAWKGEDRDSRSYIFVRAGEEAESPAKKRKREESSEDEDD
ncbi:MAG: hypothetical protein M1824_001102 [Vezdaea acicularis]|nr:MAG: hypothetical protein M1824_001102 [Vezdaea acicularis]